MTSTQVQALLAEYGYDNIHYIEYDGNIFTYSRKYKHIFDHEEGVVKIVQKLDQVDNFTKEGQIDVRQYGTIYTISFFNQSKFDELRDATIAEDGTVV